MSASFLITFREGLEAAVIVGILLSALRMFGEQKRSIFIWAGVTLGIVASLLLAWAFESFLGGFEGAAEEIYEGTLMLIAFAVITHVVLWLRKYGRNIQSELEGKVRAIFERKEIWTLAFLSFTAVAREGIETVIFLKALSIQSGGALSLWGGVLGLVAAVALAGLIFFSTLNVSPKKFFRVTGNLLVFIAAGLLAHGIVEFQGAHVLPNFVNPLFDLSGILSEDSGLGAFLKALFGYDADPSLLAVAAYGLYLGTMFYFLRERTGKPKA